MANCIIVCGHLGSTARAAQILAREIGGETVIFDTLSELPPDFAPFGKLVFGTNVRYLRLNKRFRQWAKRLKAASGEKYVYIVGATAANAGRYIRKARKVLPAAADIRFVGGYLDETGAKGLALKVIRSVKAGLIEDGLPLPKLDRKELSRLAKSIAGGKYEKKEET